MRFTESLRVVVEPRRNTEPNLRPHSLDGEPHALQLNIDEAATGEEHGVKAAASRLVGAARAFDPPPGIGNDDGVEFGEAFAVMSQST